MTEKAEQAIVVSWARLHRRPVNMLFHIPNGGSRNIVEAKNLKRAGVLAGVPDLFLPVSRMGYHGMWIEMKSEKGKLSQNQTDMIEFLESQGYRVVVAYSGLDAIAAIEDYMVSRH